MNSGYAWVHDLFLVSLGVLSTLVIVQRNKITELKAVNASLQSRIEQLQIRINDLLSNLHVMEVAYREMRGAAKSYKATADIVTAVCTKVAQQLPAALKELTKALHQASEHVMRTGKDVRRATSEPAANDPLNAANDKAA